MLRVHCANGSTLTFDLSNEDDAKRWLWLAREAEFQKTITGMTILRDGVQYSLSRPREADVFGFTLCASLDKEHRAERIECVTGDMSLALVVHHSQRAARVLLTRR